MWIAIFECHPRFQRGNQRVCTVEIDSILFTPSFKISRKDLYLNGFHQSKTLGSKTLLSEFRDEITIELRSFVLPI